MAGGIIYTKTIDPQYQDGVDNNLIIQPNYAYQQKFEFGDNWNEIILGMNLSYTFSETDNNKYTANSFSSGGTTNDTFSFIGLIKDDETKYLPEITSQNTSGRSFIGIKYYFYEVDTRSEFAGGPNDTGDVNDPVTILVNTDKNHLTYQPSNSLRLPDNFVENTTGYFGYFGIRIKINNKGQSNQSMDINLYYINNNNTGGTGLLSDPSLTTLNQRINAGNYNSYSNTNIALNDGVSASTIPDSFFFYNAFLDIRPRIHAIAVKKIS